ncbi:MAG: ATP-binding protein [Pseudomonadota bacterium]
MSLFSRSRRLELLFWISLVSVFAPVALDYSFGTKLGASLPIRLDGDQVWIAHALDEPNGKTREIQLPQDIRRDPLLSASRSWLFSTTLDVAKIKTLKKPALVLGRIGDSDVVRLGRCEVGRTGITEAGEQNGWWWGILRYYDIPANCVDELRTPSAVLSVEVHKWGGPSFGIFGGPLGIGESERVFRYASLNEISRFGSLGVFGILLFWAVGLYYLFVYLLAPGRAYHGIFGLCCMAVGTFVFITSTILYRYTSNSTLVMKLNFLSAAASSYLLVLFLRARFGLIRRWIIWAAAIGGVLAGGMGLLQGTLDGVYSVYEKWFAFFLVVYVLAYFEFLIATIRNRRRDTWIYLVGFSILILTCLHDIIVTYQGADRPYLISNGFVIILAAVAAALAKESADAYQHVEEQVSERTKDLGTALNQLRALEKMKERFFANISHDFKTPVTVALGSIEDAKRAPAEGGGKAVAPTLLPAERSLHQLLGMIQDLLDTVKAESGTLKMLWETAKPAELLREWIQPYEVLCERKGITLELDVSGCGELKVPMDVSKLRRVIDNLLSNAVKFTDRRQDANRRNHPTGIVQVTLRTDDARFYIEISDSGIGIPEDEKDKIFDRYYQSSRTSLKDHGGSGIGLSFAKEMVDLHNGTISVVKSDFGGAKFIVAMPLAQDVEVTGEHEVMPGIADEVLRGSLDVAYPPEQPRKIDPTRPTVLSAEDNPEVAQILVTALQDEFNVYFAPNGQKAWEKLRAQPFDCLITDIVMPQMRGDELVEKIRADSKLAGLPVIVVSSHQEETLTATVLRSGANDYVNKPFNRDILLARVRTQIEAHKTADWIAKNEKVIELGFLAGGMAHQIRNGLANLKNQVEAQQKMADELLTLASEMPAERRAKIEERLKKSQGGIGRATDRIERLTDAVKTYSTGSVQQTLINLKDSADLALELHADLIKKRAVRVEISGLENIHIQGYSAFHEVFVNLIGNAIGAVKDDGSGVVRVVGKDLGEEVEITVSDNGMGIKPEILPRLCRPFFTTKTPGEGWGLGLYVVRDVVEGQHRGKLTIASEGEEKGATFTVRVPKKAPEPTSQPEVIIHGVTVS